MSKEEYVRMTVLVPKSLADRIQGSKSDLVRRAISHELLMEIPPVKRGRPKTSDVSSPSR